MAGLIPQSFIDDLLSRADIVDVIDKRVALKKVAKTILRVARFTTKNPLLLAFNPKSSFTIALAAAPAAMPSALS